MSANLHAQRQLKPLEDRPVSSQQTAELDSLFAEASAAKAAASGREAEAQRRAIDRTLNGELEEFLTNHVGSAWAPAVHNYLAANYRSRGQTTRALQHWEKVWESTKDFQNGNGKNIGDEALVNWTRLLLLLGRTDELTTVYQTVANRILEPGPLMQMWSRTYEKYVRIHKYPEQSWKCGIYAMAQAAEVLNLKYKKGEFLRTPSKPTGFTLQELQQLSDEYAFGLVAVRRSENSGQLIVPSVVHLRQNHYTAIMAQRGELYKVADSSGLGVMWLTEAEINEEASGYFLIPQNRINLSFVRVPAPEAMLIFGRDGPCPPEDWEDIPCPPGTGNGGSGGSSSEGDKGGPPIIETSTSGSTAGFHGGIASCRGCGSGGGGGGGGDEDCCPEEGLPAWRVSEPYLNLWIDDVPIRYQPAKGPPVILKMRYKQRDEEDWYYWGSGHPRVALNWNCHWFSFAYYYLGVTKVVLPGGGTLAFEFPEESNLSYRHYRNNAQLEALVEEDVLVGYVLHLPDGRKLKYTQVFTAESEFQLSEQIDPQGNKLTFNYTGSLVSSITDADGNDTELFYENQTYSSLLTRVSTPDGREIQLSHDEYGQLTNIVDAAGLSSSLTYHPWVGYGYGAYSITTPYGTTSFNITGATFDADRSIIITEPDGSMHAYALWHVNTEMPTSFNASQLPSGTPFAVAGYPYGTLDWTNRHQENTFYWNAQQFASLGSTNLGDFTWTELKRARIRHWIGKFHSETGNNVDTLGHEQAPSPSPDGTAEGQVTWYDYDGKDYDAPELRGPQVLPAVIARVMPDGSTWYQHFQRNDYGHVTKETEKWYYSGSPVSRTQTFLYAANGIDLLAHTNAAGVLVSSNVFNAYHQVTTNYNALGESTVYTYNNSRQLTSVSQPAGLITTNIYDGNGRLQETTDLPINRTQTFTWYNDGNLKTFTDERGMTVTNFWDGLNRLTGQRYPDGTTTSNIYTRLEVTATKDRLGQWTYSGYDSLRRIIAETNANGIVTRYGYCPCGSVGSVTNAWGTALAQATAFEYDYQGHLLATSYADGYAVTNWYDALGRRIVTGDGWGYNWFGYSYNNLGLLTKLTNALGAVERSIVYDIEDQPFYVTDANGVTVTNIYDDLGRLRTRGYPDGGVEKFGYSARGLIAHTNQLNLVTRYVYDEAGRKLFETNANNEVIRYTNNAAGDLLSLTDGKNQTTRWKYDEYGRVTNKLDQTSAEILRYKYDPDSRLTNRWSAAKGDTKYKYDPVGNLTNIDYAASTDVKFKYDALNRVTNMVDALGTTKYTYALGGKLYTEDGPFNNDTITNTYVNRLRTKLVLQQPTGLWTNSFAYDSAKRLTNVTSQAGSFAYTFDSQRLTLIQKLLLPNTSAITNAYDSVARLTGTYLKTSGGVLTNKHEYVYNVASQRTQQTRKDASTVDYAYDKISQLKVANSSVNSEDRGYTYDSAWNLNYRTNNGSPEAFSVDSKNQLTTVPDGMTCTYDSNGNLTEVTDGAFWSFRYEYDDENRLVSWEQYNLDGDTSEAITWFGCDGLGRLRLRTDFDPDNEFYPVTCYVYDGMRVIQQRATDTEDTDLELATPTISYTRGTDLSGSLEGAGGIGGLLARSHGYSSGNWSTHNFYHADGNGNVTYMLNSSQSKVAEYRYDPFGNTISKSGSLADANVYRFSSKEIHPSSGMYYYGYRFYDPYLQRWPNRDPLGEEGGINLYGFTENDPVNFVDPYGENIIKIIIKLFPKKKPPTPPKPPPNKPKPKPNPCGDCTPAQHAVLQGAVTAACKTGARACNPTQDSDTLKANLAMNLACAAARDAVNKTCYKGGDPGHKQAADDARRAAQKCADLIAQKALE